MPTSEELTDTYLAALLVRDAENVRKGIVSSQARPRNAPKPNVRFLKSVIRDTTSHNAALLEKEEDLHKERARSQRRAAGAPVDRDEDRPSKRRRREERPDKWSFSLAQSGLVSDRHAAEHERRENHGRSSGHSSAKHDRDIDTRARSRHKHNRSLDNSRADRYESNIHRRRRATRSRSSSVSSRSSPSARTHSKSGSEARRKPQPSALGPAEQQSNEDSDPLDDIIGPRPAGSMRGRGRTAGASGIDARFRDPAYDPSADTRGLDEDPDQDDADEDWNQALAGLRERFKRRAVNADRLLAAGFDEQDVRRWKDGSNEGRSAADDIDSVVWRKRGEAREWDGGKVLDQHGVTTKPEWAKKSA